eukprot:symbB.v1.2.004122.t1/scaffold205.1/size269685/11
MAAQHVTLSFLLDWMGFDRLSAVSPQLWKLCHQQASWEGIQLMAEGLNQSQSSEFGRPEGGMNHWIARYLRLGMAFEHSKRPILLGQQCQHLKSLVKAFGIHGFAWPWGFASLERTKTKKQPKMPFRGNLLDDDGGPFEQQQQVLLSFPENVTQTRSQHPVLARTWPSLGDTWFQVHYAEVTWTFDPKVMNEADIFSLGFSPGGKKFGIYLCVETSEELEEEDYSKEAWMQDTTGLFEGAGTEILNSPHCLDVRLTSLQSGDRFGLGVVKMLAGSGRPEVLMVGLVLLLNQKVIGCYWCSGMIAFQQEAMAGLFLHLSAAAGSLEDLRSPWLLATYPSHGMILLESLEEWLKLLETAPVLRAKSPSTVT